MTPDEFDAQVNRRGLTSRTGCAQWLRLTWVAHVRGYLILGLDRALYVLDADHILSATRHGPFATFDEAFGVYILLGSGA